MQIVNKKSITILIVAILTISSLSLTAFASKSTVDNGDYQLEGSSYALDYGTDIFGNRITKCSVYSFTTEVDDSSSPVYVDIIRASGDIYVNGSWYDDIEEELENAAAASDYTTFTRSSSSDKVRITIDASHYSFGDGILSTTTSDYVYN